MFGGSKDGMHQRSFSVSSADQWNEAINTSTSSAARKTCTRERSREFGMMNGGDPNCDNEAIAGAAAIVAAGLVGGETEESRLTRCHVSLYLTEVR